MTMTDCTCNNFPASLGNVTFGANVGIGTANPITKLHVNGVGASAARFNFYNDAALSSSSPRASGRGATLLGPAT
jgi:hypothetical protein